MNTEQKALFSTLETLDPGIEYPFLSLKEIELGPIG